MLADDRTAWPMSFYLRLVFSGELDRADFREAVQKALTRHPLLRSKLVGDAKGRTARLRWEEVPVDLSALVRFAREEKDDEDAAESSSHDFARAIDLAEGPGFRLYVRESSGTVTVLAQFHHSATDGTGGLRFLEDVMALYKSMAEGSMACLRPLSTELLEGRGRFHFGIWALTLRILKDLARAWLFFRNVPKAIALPPKRVGASRAASPDGPASVMHGFSRVETAALRAMAKARGVTVNDLLLRDLFVAVDLWNRAHGPARPIRLAMAMSMRRATDDAMPAANVVSMCFLDRKDHELADPAVLLASVQRETRYIKANDMGMTLVRVAALLGRVPRGLGLLMTPRYPWLCHASAVLSNLGEPYKETRIERDEDGRLDLGGLRLETVELLPPIRPHTLASFGVVTEAGRLSVTLHYDDRSLDAGQAAELLETFVREVRKAVILPQAAESGRSRLRVVPAL
jgi:NRPS condensation-like uncharacterized protein